jgi:SsrA-binding protein
MSQKGRKQPKSAGQGPVEIRNTKARHDYFIGQSFEAGIQLTGTEVKSIRAGKAQLTEAFCRIDADGSLNLYHAYISEYAFGSDQNHKPTRPRKLLLHQREIKKIRQEIEAGGQALIPLRLYFKQALIKLEIALCKGKKLYDKRETLKRKQSDREAQRDLSQARMQR